MRNVLPKFINSLQTHRAEVILWSWKNNHCVILPVHPRILPSNSRYLENWGTHTVGKEVFVLVTQMYKVDYVYRFITL